MNLFQDHLSALKFIVSNLLPYKKYLLINSTIVFLISILESVGIVSLIPIMQTILNDKVENEFILQVFSKFNIQQSNSLEVLLVIFSFLMVSKFFLTFLAGKYVNYIQMIVSINNRTQMVKKYLGVKWSYLVSNHIGEATNIMSVELDRVSRNFSLFSNFLSNSVQVIFFIIVSFYINFNLTMLVIILSSLFLFFYRNIFIQSKKRINKHFNYKQDFSRYLVSMLSGFKIIKSMNFEKKLFKNLSKNIKNSESSRISAVNLKLKLVFFQDLFVFISMIILFFLIFNFSNNLEIEKFVVLMIFFAKAFQKVNQQQKGWQLIYESQLPLKTITRFKNNLVQNKEYDVGDIRTKPKIRSINFENVDFAHIPKKKILSKFCCKFEKGKLNIIFGKSGSGKSTILDLMMRLIEPQNGSIFVNRTNINKLNLSQYRKQIGYVEQNLYLFNNTLHFNICFEETDISHKRVLKIIKLLDLDPLLNELKLGLNTNVGERGDKFSGGQRQKISLARALYRSPQILILDEPTSSLDRRSEKLFMETLKKIKENIIVVMITHSRLNLKYADNIIRL